MAMLALKGNFGVQPRWPYLDESAASLFESWVPMKAMAAAFREAAAAAPKPFWARFFGKKKKPKSENGDVNLEEVYEELDELESFEVEYFDDPQLLQNRPWPERALVLSGGVIFNILLIFL